MVDARWRRIEAGAVRALSRLPSAAQMALAGGRPVRIDGQLLEPEVQLLLRLLAFHEQQSFEELPVPDAREAIAVEAALVGPATPVPMATVEDLPLPGPAGALGARLYVPHGIASPSPLLVYLHGGGWTVCDLETHDSVCRFLACEAAVRVLSVAYRLAPEHPFPAAVEDSIAALQFARESAARLGADPARVAVGGDSAGGNLAAVASLAARGERWAPAFQLLIYPVTDAAERTRSYRLFGEGFFLTTRQMGWYEDNYLGPGRAAAADWRASPLRAPDLTGTAPAHVVAAGFDPLRDEGVAYAMRLKDAGVPVSLRVETGLVHGFANMTAVGRAARGAMLDVAAVLRAALSGPAGAQAS